MCLGRIYGARAVRHNSTSSKRYMDGVKPILEQSCMVSDDDTLFYVTCSCHKLIKKRKKYPGTLVVYLSSSTSYTQITKL